MLLPGHAAVALVGAVVLVLAAGCSSHHAVGHTGGTLYDLEPADFAHLDPARVDSAQEADYGRLLYRTLTTYAYSSQGGVHLVPDLATSTGAANADATVWTYTLRPGLKYQDGSTITSSDIAYGLSRNFPDATNQIRARLIPGPIAIATPDPKTIVFHFAKPFVDFPYAAALPVTAPVPRAKDTGSAYDTQVVSSGPYKIASYVRGSSLTLTRNIYWDASSDLARKAFPDVVATTFGASATAIDARLMADTGLDQQAVSMSPVQPDDVDEVEGSPSALARSQNGYDNGISFLAFNPASAALRNILVRQALEYAYPHFDARETEGGAVAADVATGVISPGLAAYRKLKIYDTPRMKGDPAQTRQLLAEAGVHALTLTYAAANTPAALATAAVVVSAYALAGVTIHLVPNDGSPPSADLIDVDYLPSRPTASDVLATLFSCHSPLHYCDPLFDAALQVAQSEVDLMKADKEYAALNGMLMSQAVVIPRYATKRLDLHGSKVQNTEPAAGYQGLVDLANLAVR